MVHLNGRVGRVEIGRSRGMQMFSLKIRSRGPRQKKEVKQRRERERGRANANSKFVEKRGSAKRTFAVYTNVHVCRYAGARRIVSFRDRVSLFT